MKNNIKNNLTNQKFLLLRENCEKYILKNKNINTRISLISFFSSTNPIKNIYIDLAFNAYNKSFQINMYFLIFFLISQLCQIIYSFIDIDKKSKYKLRIIISEGIALIILSLFFGLLFIKKNRENKIFILSFSWIILFNCIINQLLVIYNNKNEQQELYLSKFYHNLIMPHFLMIMMITANMSLHFGHFFVIFFIDIFLIIILSIINSKNHFYHHVNIIFCIGVLTFFQSYKFELSYKLIFDYFIEKYYLYLINEDIINNADIGVCLTSSDDFEIIKMNNEMEENNEIIDLENDKNKKFLLYNLLYKKKYNDNEKESEKLNLYQAIDEITTNYISNGKIEDLKYFVPLGRFKTKHGTKLFNVKFKRIYSNKDNKNQNNKNESDSNTTNQIINMLNISDLIQFNQIQKNIMTTTTNIDSHLSENNINQIQKSFNYKFIFTLIAENRKELRMKIEKIYQKLILTKMEEEFKPIQCVKDLIDKIIKEKEKIEDKEKDNSDFLPELLFKTQKTNKNKIKDFQKIYDDEEKRSLSSIESGLENNIYNNIETFSYIKYIVETIKLTVLDLSEYIQIHSTIKKKNEKFEVQQYYLGDLRDYIEGISNAYLNLIDKNLNIITRMDINLTKRSFEIDKDKLNQIISNLVRNAIINTKNKNNIYIDIEKMKENDLKHFEFDSNNNLFIKQNTLGSPNSPFISHQNSSIELGLVITIEDTGQGISNDLKNNINNDGENFYRIDTNDTKFDTNHTKDNIPTEKKNKKGLGTGLKICRKLSDEINVKLKCQIKSNNQGTIFKIFLKTELLD